MELKVKTSTGGYKIILEKGALTRVEDYLNLDRKVLADLAVNNPEAFKAIVTTVKEK